jgi:hypothetical protein
MAKVYVTEFVGADEKTNVLVPAPKASGFVQQTPITLSGTSAQSAAFAAGTSLVRVHTDATCSVEFGSNPTATTNHLRMAADQTEYFAVVPGTKIAVISNT